MRIYYIQHVPTHDDNRAAMICEADWGAGTRSITLAHKSTKERRCTASITRRVTSTPSHCYTLRLFSFQCSMTPIHCVLLQPTPKFHFEQHTCDTSGYHHARSYRRASPCLLPRTPTQLVDSPGTLLVPFGLGNPV